MRMRAKPRRDVARGASSLVGTSFIVGLFAAGAPGSGPRTVDIDPTPSISIRSTLPSLLRRAGRCPEPRVGLRVLTVSSVSVAPLSGAVGRAQPQDMLAFATKVQSASGHPMNSPSRPWPRRPSGVVLLVMPVGRAGAWLRAWDHQGRRPHARPRSSARVSRADPCRRSLAGAAQARTKARASKLPWRKKPARAIVLTLNPADPTGLGPVPASGLATLGPRGKGSRKDLWRPQLPVAGSSPCNDAVFGATLRSQSGRGLGIWRCRCAGRIP